MTDTNDKPMYGIWIYGKGWLRGEKDVISFDDYQFALEVARIMSAKVRRIDTSYLDLETLYKEQEGKSLWHIFKNLFVHKNNTQHSK